MPIPRDGLHMPDHVPCACGHLGWRHHRDGRCARCECARYAQPVDPEPYTLQPRRWIRRRTHGGRPV